MAASSSVPLRLEALGFETAISCHLKLMKIWLFSPFFGKDEMSFLFYIKLYPFTNSKMTQLPLLSPTALHLHHQLQSEQAEKEQQYQVASREKGTLYI